MVLLVRFIDSVLSAAQGVAGMGVARNALERLGAVLDEPPFPQPAEPKTPRDASAEFTGVVFRYDVGTADGASARPVLNDVTFRLAERGMTALVEPSGAGKTTVAALTAGFRDATEGPVRIRCPPDHPWTSPRPISRAAGPTPLFAPACWISAAIGQPGSARRPSWRSGRTAASAPSRSPALAPAVRTRRRASAYARNC